MPPSTPRATAGDAGPEPGGAGHVPADVLNDLLDGRLSVDTAARTLAHLDVCAHCRAERDALGQVIALGRHGLAPTPPVPSDVWPLLAATTIHERAIRGRVLRGVRTPLLVTVLVLCALSAVLGGIVGRRFARQGQGAAPAPVRGTPALVAPPGSDAAGARRWEAEMRTLREREREAAERAAGASGRTP
jgi:hypothetical protein